MLHETDGVPTALTYFKCKRKQRFELRNKLNFFGVYNRTIKVLRISKGALSEVYCSEKVSKNSALILTFRTVSTVILQIGKSVFFSAALNWGKRMRRLILRQNHHKTKSRGVMSSDGVFGSTGFPPPVYKPAP